ncbi:MAG: argininosuccinate synthase [Candidatus Omnitrophica bacterium]|nr:argininosuccinate synthase [Candidatus Omnitrophota bacterium]
MADKKLILAYSGGLDTSVAIKWLMDRGYEVICYMGDLGQGGDAEDGKKRALRIGAKKCIVEDLQEEFVSDYIFPALKAGALYQRKYNLATALSRPIIAERMLKVAKSEKAEFVAHGCTGKGNDQVRFEVTFHLKMPGVKVIAPVREWELKTRESEIDYAKKHNIPIAQTKKKIYSIDKNLWGISVEGGDLEDPAKEPKDNAYITIARAEDAPARPEYVTVSFNKGIPVAVNGKKLDPIGLILKLNAFGAKHGVGRIDMVEDRLVGIKSREVYEAPASDILHVAHTALEDLVLDRETIKYKYGVADKYSDLVYNGLWFTPLKEAFDAFIDKTQKRVTGDIKIKLYKGRAVAVSRKSPFSRYSLKLATYGKEDIFDQSLAKGFIDLWAMPYRSK